MERIRWLLATCAGFGYSPILPGTCGALWALPIYLGILLGTPPAAHTLLIAGALIVVCAITVWLDPWALAKFGEKDSGIFVTDEVAGFLLTVLLFRPSGTTLWVQTLAAFFVTRTIDICKIPPAKRLEHLPGGWGVLADDMLGSVYAALLLWFIWWQFPGWFSVGSV